jgi:hypothetical protein
VVLSVHSIGAPREVATLVMNREFNRLNGHSGLSSKAAQPMEPKVQQQAKSFSTSRISRDKLAELLNKDLSRKISVRWQAQVFVFRPANPYRFSCRPPHRYPIRDPAMD